jgi:hypothetical protein
VSEYSETQVGDPSSLRLLDAARAVECVALMAGAGLAIMTMPLPGALVAGALVGMAAVIRPRERVPASTARTDVRRQVLRRLTAEGMVLRWRYNELRKMPIGQARSDALWSIRRDITVWLETGLDSVDRYPEVAGILKAHRTTGGLVDELDSVLQRLGEIRRLAMMSDKLKLPF